MKEKTLDSAQELAKAIRRRRAEVARMTPEEQAKREQKKKAFAERHLRLINDSLDDFVN